MRIIKKEDHVTNTSSSNHIWPSFGHSLLKKEDQVNCG